MISSVSTFIRPNFACFFVSKVMFVDKFSWSSPCDRVKDIRIFAIQTCLIYRNSSKRISCYPYRQRP